MAAEWNPHLLSPPYLIADFSPFSGTVNLEASPAGMIDCLTFSFPSDGLDEGVESFNLAITSVSNTDLFTIGSPGVAQVDILGRQYCNT